MGKPWILKYEPKKIEEVIGQETQVREIKEFIVNFKKNRKKGMIVYGGNGTGKTCSVYAISNELGLEVVETNASDFRTAKAIGAHIGNACKQMSLFFKGKVILVDEVDGLSGTKDRGGMPELIKVLEKTAFPIIFTALDPFSSKFSGLRRKTEMLEFNELGYEHVLLVLKKICEEEKIDYEELALKGLSRRSGGDMRAAINDFQMLASVNNSLTRKDLDSLSDRERKEEIETALRIVFKTTDPLTAVGAYDGVVEDLDKIRLWVDENLPKEYKKPADLARAYDYISKSDIMSRRIRRWQHWRFMVYINAYLSAGIAVSKDEKYKELVKYTETKRLLKIWMANRKYEKRKAIAQKIAEITHTSTRVALKSSYPFLKTIFQKCKNKDTLNALTNELELSKEEVFYLKR